MFIGFFSVFSSVFVNNNNDNNWKISSHKVTLRKLTPQPTVVSQLKPFSMKNKNLVHLQCIRKKEKDTKKWTQFVCFLFCVAFFFLFFFRSLAFRWSYCELIYAISVKSKKCLRAFKHCVKFGCRKLCVRNVQLFIHEKFVILCACSRWSVESSLS